MKVKIMINNTICSKKQNIVNTKCLYYFFQTHERLKNMLEFLIKKAKEANKEIDAQIKRVVLKDSKFPQSTVIIYNLENEQPVCKVIFSKEIQK